MRRITPSGPLGTVCVALIALIAVYWMIWARARPLPEPVVPSPDALMAVAVARPEPDPGAVAAFTARPLFSIDRRPAPVVTDDNTQVAANPCGEARLVGIVDDPEGGVAIILRGNSRFRVRRDKQFDGWTLTTLEKRVARFVNPGGGECELQLHKPASGKIVATPAKQARPNPPP